MKILFDHDTPRPLRRFLTDHTIATADEMGWATIRNGTLLDNAEREGYEILITADQSLRYQQNLEHRQIAIVVLLSNRWADVRMRVDDISAALEGILPGELREVPI